VDVSVLVEEVAGAASAAAEKSGVTLTVADLAPGAAVEGSPASLRRALMALLDNAVSHAISAVTISVRTSGRQVEIEVSDDGPGIPQAIAPRLFDRFSTLRTEEAVPEGRRHYGLGLALVADVAANHQGRVSVAGREDGGSGAVFTLTLPAHR
jgi:signal transduction histidine kinase